VKGYSVALLRSTANWSAVRSLRHSASVWVTSKASLRAAAIHPGEIDTAAMPIALWGQKTASRHQVSSCQFVSNRKRLLAFH
jgi:hypothetical protein